jgi:hypothetical protein
MNRLPVDVEVYPPEPLTSQKKAHRHEEHGRREGAALRLLGKRGEEANRQGDGRDRGGLHNRYFLVSLAVGGVVEVEAAARVPLRTWVAMCGDPAGSLQHPRQVEQISGYQRGVVSREVVLGAPGAGIQLRDSRSRSSNAFGCFLWGVDFFVQGHAMRKRKKECRPAIAAWVQTRNSLLVKPSPVRNPLATYTCHCRDPHAGKFNRVPEHPCGIPLFGDHQGIPRRGRRC